jgi:hypothetical protein
LKAGKRSAEITVACGFENYLLDSENHTEIMRFLFTFLNLMDLQGLYVFSTSSSSFTLCNVT